MGDEHVDILRRILNGQHHFAKLCGNYIFLNFKPSLTFKIFSLMLAMMVNSSQLRRRHTLLVWAPKMRRREHSKPKNASNTACFMIGPAKYNVLYPVNNPVRSTNADILVLAESHEVLLFLH